MKEKKTFLFENILMLLSIDWNNYYLRTLIIFHQNYLHLIHNAKHMYPCSDEIKIVIQHSYYYKFQMLNC